MNNLMIWNKTKKGKTYEQLYGKDKSKIIKEKIGLNHRGKKHTFKNQEGWRKNLSNSLSGRMVWNKGKKVLQKAWNKKYLPTKDIIKMYLDEKLSSEKIADKFNVSRSVISRIFKENSVKIRKCGDYRKGKKLEQILGEEKAKEVKNKLSKKFKGRACTWKGKVSEGIKKYYKEHKFPESRRENMSKLIKELWKTQEYRNKLVQKHKEYLKNNPEELERLKKIQYPGKITKIEQKMLNFLKQKFREGEDFYFDKQDITNKTFYRPDFQFPKQKIIIELDGYYKHFTKEGYQKDRIREYYLKKAGWKIYRFNYFAVERTYLFEKTKEKVLNILKND